MILGSDFNAATMTPESCVTVCGKSNMKYAGLTEGNQCHCSNTTLDISKSIGDVACYYPCAGDKSLKCGSDLYFSVYAAPGQFVFPFFLSFTNVSKPFTPIRFSTAPAYKDADVRLNFGDGTSVITKSGSYYDYAFTTIGEHEVFTNFMFRLIALMETIFSFIIQGFTTTGLTSRKSHMR